MHARLEHIIVGVSFTNYAVYLFSCVGAMFFFIHGNCKLQLVIGQHTFNQYHKSIVHSIVATIIFIRLNSSKAEGPICTGHVNYRSYSLLEVVKLVLCYSRHSDLLHEYYLLY